MTKTFPEWAKGALWIGLGALIGLAFGAVIIDILQGSDNVGEYALPWLVTVVAYVAIVLLLARRTAAPVASTAPVATPAPVAPKPRPAAPAPTRPATASQLALDFHFPEVPPEFPPVMGHAEPLRVMVRVTHLGKPAIGAALRMTGQLRDGAQFLAGEGVTGADGAVVVTVPPRGTGEMLLEAEAKLEVLVGFGHTSVSIVRYDEEIERLFGEFRAYATGVLGPASATDTARELAEKLRSGSPPEVSRALLELARIYELVAYGERDADRSLYLSLMHALLVLERGDMPGPAPQARPAEV